MTPTGTPVVPAANLFSRRNLVLIAVALLTITAGYLILVNGSPSLAAVLLVLGYVVIFPLALIL
jgi:hypothetical protein